MNGKYIITAIRVPQVPVDNNHDVVVVYDKDTKKCACSNKFASQLKSRNNAIEILKGIA